MDKLDKYIEDHLASARAAALIGDFRIAYHHIFRAMQDLMLNAQWKRISNELDEICSMKYPAEFGLGAVRFSYGGSRKIPDWDLIINKLKETATAQGKDVKRLMRGLLNE